LGIKRIKPAFWDHTDVAAGQHHLFNFRRKWVLLVVLTSVVSLTPLLLMTWVDYRLTRTAIESDVLQNTSELVSNTWRAVAFFLSEREAAMQFVAQDNALDELSQPERLRDILANLKKGVGGFFQLAVVDAQGRVLAAAGRGALPEADFSEEYGFRETLIRGDFIYTEVGPDGKAPDGEASAGDALPDQGLNLVIGVKHQPAEGSAFILRAVVDPRPLHQFLGQIVMEPKDDAFLIDYQGRLVTPSRRQTTIINLPTPEPVTDTRVLEVVAGNGRKHILGYAYIPRTALILILDKPKTQMARLWLKPRLQLIGFLIVNILVILLVIIGVATFMVNRIHQADQRRIMNLHQASYANKLAGIGRLASGVAHEINNPLAVINEKIGLIQDLLTLQSDRPVDPRLVPHIKTAGEAVVRATTVTRRLLNFARHMEAHVERFELADMLEEIAAFLTKEAERRCVAMQISLPKTALNFETDRGNLQQILLNLFNNALEAMPEGGRLSVGAEKMDANLVRITLADTGAGIPADDLQRIFDPFFTTKTTESGTGLGLSVTYSLVQEIGGEIQVFSQVDEGTRFELLLPLVHPGGNGGPVACQLVS
jgi:signal transduction histidine kinase